MQVALRICVRNAPASALVFWDEKQGDVSALLSKIFLNFVYIDGRVSALDKNFVVIIKVYNLRFESVDAPRKADSADDQKETSAPQRWNSPMAYLKRLSSLRLLRMSILRSFPILMI